MTTWTIDGYRLYHAQECAVRVPGVSPAECTCSGLTGPLYNPAKGVPMSAKWYKDGRRPWDPMPRTS